MDGGVREIGEASGVIGIGVGEDDVADIIWREAELFDTAEGGVVFVELEACHVDELLAEAFDGVLDVEEADAGVDQSEAGFVFQQ